MRRRELLGALAAAGAAAALPGRAWSQRGDESETRPIPRKGRIKQGLWQVNFGRDSKLSFDEMCAFAAHVGVAGFDMTQPRDWPTLQKHGLVVTCGGPGGGDFASGIVHTEAHDTTLEAMTKHVDTLADGGVRRFAINAGQRRGLSYAECADNAVAYLRRIKDKLEARDVTICFENVNDRRPNDRDLGRQDQAFSHLDWGLDVVARVGSPNVKILCDIYHLQIMDGDVAWRIRESIGAIGHFHVAGVPTRTEIDDTQELNFRYIAQVIAELPYDGYVSHEWRPSPGHDPLESIARAVELLDV